MGSDVEFAWSWMSGVGHPASGSCSRRWSGPTRRRTLLVVGARAAGTGCSTGAGQLQRGGLVVGAKSQAAGARGKRVSLVVWSRRQDKKEQSVSLGGGQPV